MPAKYRKRPCKATSKRTREACGAHAMKNREVCYHHGGKSLSGPAHPRFKNGRYSEALPAQLAQRYEEARTNPRLLSLSEDVALAEARLAELLATVQEGASGATWQALKQALDAFSLALRQGDMVGMNTEFTRMQQLVQEGAGQAATWQEIRKTWEVRCRLIQTETKTLATMQQMVTVQQLMLYLGAVTDAVTRAVRLHADQHSGRAILQDVMVEFQRLSTLEEAG